VAVDLLKDKCIYGLTANRDRASSAVLSSSAIATVLAARLGYDVTEALVRTAQQNDQSFLSLAIATGHISQVDADAIVKAAAQGDVAQ
jgi:aspartate ammonia-lyase